MKLDKLSIEIKKKHDITTKYDRRLIPYIVRDKMTTDSDAGGARAVVSRIEREVTTEISRFINKNPSFKNKTMYVIVEGELASEHKNQLETNAHIVVSDAPPERM
jgi:ATP-dependent Clp protease ATP-binding subunit ClpA